MENIEKVMSLYGIRPVNISKVSDRVHKITDQQHQYALKRSVLTSQSVTRWEHVFHHAQQHQLSNILSVYLTKNNSLYAVITDEYFYLMPWIEGEQTTIEQLYRSLGKIHRHTQQFQSIDPSQMMDHFKQYNQHCDEMQKKLFTYVQQFESHVYMSPLELQVCTHYRDIELVIKKLQEQTKRLIDSGKERTKWSYSLCHGNLKRSHTVAHMEHVQFLNWERASDDYPAIDLSILLKNEWVYYDAPVEKWTDTFKVYMEENRLQNDELALLLIHLLDPTSYMSFIQQYIERTSRKSMIHQVRNIQIEYRRLIFGLQWVDFINQHYFSVINHDLDH